MKQDKLTDGSTQVTRKGKTTIRHGAQGKTRLNTQKGNHRTRHSWAGEAETQGRQVNTIRNRRANTGRT